MTVTVTKDAEDAEMEEAALRLIQVPFDPAIHRTIRLRLYVRLQPHERGRFPATVKFRRMLAARIGTLKAVWWVSAHEDEMPARDSNGITVLTIGLNPLIYPPTTNDDAFANTGESVIIAKNVINGAVRAFLDEEALPPEPQKAAEAASA